MSEKKIGPAVAPTAIAALGVVYGDIGTSPLYALKACFSADAGVAPTFENVTGILSLIFWAITWIVVVKYLTVLMRANNHGEGGIMALIALLVPRKKSTKIRSKVQKQIILLGLFGAALLYGDGMITPAVSVLSAVEGLGIATPLLNPVIVPLTVLILAGLFWVQSRGTEKVGAIFGPIMLLWFAVIGAAGLPWLVKHPEVFLGLNPLRGIDFILHHGFVGALVLTGVVLCITGAEALYADMGHFGPGPIRRAWYFAVYPALVLNYFGQGALLLEHPEAIRSNPFFAMVPSFFVYPMVALATLATVIASQALISGAFSMTQQAISLGYLPRFRVFHTSTSAEGQIYVPKVNQFLFISCVSLVLAFRTSDALTGAYGIAVTGTMLITSLLFFQVSRVRWQWPVWQSFAVAGAFAFVDIAMLVPNFTKILHGGWVPVVAAVILFILMTTWARGQEFILANSFARSLSIEEFRAKLAHEKPIRVKGTSLFLTREHGRVPGDLLNNYKHNQVVHENVILLILATEHVPETPPEDHGRIVNLGDGFHEVHARFGFMQRPNLGDILKACEAQGMKLNPSQISFYLSRNILRAKGPSNMATWRKKFYAFTSTNAQPVMEFLGVQPEWVIETGILLDF